MHFESTAWTVTPSARQAAASATVPAPQPISSTRAPRSICIASIKRRAPGSMCRCEKTPGRLQARISRPWSRNANSQAKFLRFLSGSVLVPTYSTPVEDGRRSSLRKILRSSSPSQVSSALSVAANILPPSASRSWPDCRRSRVSSASPPAEKGNATTSASPTARSTAHSIRKFGGPVAPIIHGQIRAVQVEIGAVHDRVGQRSRNASGKLCQAGRRTQHSPRRHLRHGVNQQRFLGIRRDFAAHASAW